MSHTPLQETKQAAMEIGVEKTLVMQLHRCSIVYLHEICQVQRQG